ncbi:MAG: hypothetical protein CMO16_00685 [Thaumarchaeota archaeon]|nr:hypothetical protein [Nitrososphaerota archaeon]
MFRSYKEARKFVHSLKLKNKNEWKQYCKSNEKPNDIPSLPDKIYRNKGWNGYLDWLGNEAKRGRELWLGKYFSAKQRGESSEIHRGRKYTGYKNRG